MSNKADQVIETILTKLKSRQMTWDKPFTCLSHKQINHLTGKAYRGSNLWVLSMQSVMEGYTSGQWLTFKQCQDLKGQVKKGEKGTQIVFWNQTSDKLDETGNIEKEGFGFWKVYTVFAVEQTTIELKTIEIPRNISPKRAEIKGQKIEHRINIDIPCYMGGLTDTVYMPEIEAFKDWESYLSVLFHESIHWTGHETRLNRKEYLNYKTMRPEEEVIAELGSALLSAQNETFYKVQDNNSAYIQSWLKRAESKDLRAYLSAAQKAADYVQERLNIITITEEKTGAIAI